MTYTLDNTDTFISKFDIMDLDDGLANEIMAKVKINYVEKHHPYAISYIESKGYWKTYVREAPSPIGDSNASTDLSRLDSNRDDTKSPRKGVTRKTKEDLISYLYSYYKEEENTVAEIFEQTLVYRKEILNRSDNTITRDRYVYESFVPAELAGMKISQVSEEYLNQLFSDTVRPTHPTDKALKSYKSLLCSIFDYAVLKKLIVRNPAKWINLEHYFKDCDHGVRPVNERIFTPEEIERIKACLREKIAKRSYNPQCYAILFSIESGVRVGEIPPLRWSDIDNGLIHIYRQQVHIKEKGKPERFEIVNYTKNERRHPMGGRFFPVTESIESLLKEIKEMQEAHGVESEYIFCYEDGTPLKKNSITNQIYKNSLKLGLPIKNNHAFRKSLNSNVLIPAGFTVSERAYLLGHSVDTNQKYYSFVREESLDKIRDALNNSSLQSIQSVSSRLQSNQDISLGALKESSDDDCASAHSQSLKNIVDFPKEKSLANA